MRSVVLNFLFWVTFFLFCGADFAEVARLQAQESRYELGRRLKRFEQHWESADEQSRARSTEWLEKAVLSFFSLQLTEAGKWLDRAKMSLDKVNDPDAAVAWRLSRRLEVKPLLADVEHTELQLKLKAFYDLNGGAEEDIGTAKIKCNCSRLCADVDTVDVN